MLSGAKDAFFSVFKWKRHDESSLSSGLLEDVHHEIEMSEYQRAPSPGSESPSGLLDGESLNVEPIADLDLFFEGLYSYYCEKGLWCIITKWIVELLSLAFIICFSGFFLLFVDWNGLRNAKCGMDAVESGIKPCDLAKDALHQHPLTPFTFSKGVIVGYLSIFSIYWVFCFLRFFAQLKGTLKIRQFYHNSLCLTDNEIQTMPWASILEKVVKLQSSQQLCVIKDLSAHDVVMRLMRKENYLIGMLNKGVIAFPLSRWVPGAGPTVKYRPNGTHYRLILSKTLEWTLNWCILQSMFDRKFCVRRDFVSNPKTLQKRLMVVGLVVLLFSPFLVIFMLVYLFLRHAEQFYNHPSAASSRRWSNLSKWIVREFNEVEHLFKHRINGSVPQASDYLKQFPSPIITIIAKFVSFVSGGFAAILIIIAFLEESLLEGHIFGRNLLWYAAVFGTITAISRAAVTDELLVLDPKGAMSLVVQHTHYMPKRWRGKENTDFVRMEFETLFQYTGMMLLEEMASIFLTPYLLIFVVPKRVDDILQFIKDFTVDVEGVGHVCSFSVFDFQRHGNSNYGSPHNSPSIQRSSQGKLEKSFLSFHYSYPTWEPNAQGKRFLSTLKEFRDRRMLQQETMATTLASSTMTMDVHRKNYPYIMDWYYTSHPRSYSGDSDDVAVESFDPCDIAKEESREKEKYVENWDDFEVHRSQSHLEASTSAPLLAGTVLQQNQWWQRPRRSPIGEDPQTSFLEPPNFYQKNIVPDNYHDGLSDRSVEEEEEEEERQFEWKSSERWSRTYYMDDLVGGSVGGEFDLHFDDIFSRPADNTSDPTNS